MRQTRKLALGLLAVALATACTDNGVFNPLNNASGTYTLTVYQGRSIPATFTTFIVTGGTLVLSNNGNFSETNNFSDRSTGQASQFVSQGTWTLNGNQLSLFAPRRMKERSRRSAPFSLSSTGKSTPYRLGSPIFERTDTMGILAWIVVGLVAGVLASLVMGGTGYGIIGDIVIGIVGAFIGGWLFNALGISQPFGGMGGTIFVAFIGAVVLLLILRVIRGSMRRV